MFLRNTLFVLQFLMTTLSFAQYPPAAGQPGTTAIHSDSSVFVAWATCCEVVRGPINILDLQGVVASFGEAENALGIAAGNSVDVVSLGDMGQATVTFDVKIADGESWDFAVFENALNDTFLELAFVQVSSDGINFYTFPAVSLTNQFIQVETFGELDCTKIHNFAGKYRQGFGTPFDLDELNGTPGLDLQNVSHVRVIDAIGCIQNQYASFDSQGHVVNDPWPTAFDMGGFDLDAVGVINTSETGIDEGDIAISVFPNPFVDSFRVKANIEKSAMVEIYSSTGLKVLSKDFVDQTELELKTETPGVYFLRLISGKQVTSVRLLKLK